MYIDRETLNFEKNPKNPRKSVLFLILVILFAGVIGFIIVKNISGINKIIKNQPLPKSLYAQMLEREQKIQK